MKNRKNKNFLLLSGFLVLALIAGCGKKPQPQPAQPAPPPPAPTASITASPTSIEKGQSARLTWRTSNADDVRIDGIGKVEETGSMTVTPEDSTSYRLVARGAGGTQEATTRITVTVPAVTPVETRPSLTDEQWFARNIKHIFFDYDQYEIRADQRATLAANARLLGEKPNLRFTIEGHCDERGSTEYNLSLGDKRANAVRDALIAAGVSPARIGTISFGKEKPMCTEANEACWQQNRRGHFNLR